MAKIPTRRINAPMLIGIFVISGTIILAGVILWLGASEIFKKKSFYVTYIDGSVSGLETGSPVKYQGVPAGTIHDINVAPDGKLIEIVFQIDRGININDSLRIKSELSGLTGARFLQLYYPEDPNIAQMFPKINFNPPHQVIRSSPSQLEEMSIAMRDVLENLKALNVAEISTSTVQFLNSTSDFFSNPEMYQTIENLTAATDRLKGIMNKADTSNILEYIANSAGLMYQTTYELKSFSDKLNEKLDKLELDVYFTKALDKYDSTMSKTSNIVESVGFRAETVIFNLNEALEEIKVTNRQLRKSLRAISDDPSNVFLSEPPPKEN